MLTKLDFVRRRCCCCFCLLYDVEEQFAYYKGYKRRIGYIFVATRCRNNQLQSLIIYNRNNSFFPWRNENVIVIAIVVIFFSHYSEEPKKIFMYVSSSAGSRLLLSTHQDQRPTPASGGQDISVRKLPCYVEYDRILKLPRTRVFLPPSFDCMHRHTRVD